MDGRDRWMHVTDGTLFQHILSLHLPFTLFQHILFLTTPLHTFPKHFITYPFPTHFPTHFILYTSPTHFSDTFYFLHLPYTLFQHMRQAGITESLPPTLDTETPGCCYRRQGRLRVPELEEVHGRKESSPLPTQYTWAPFGTPVGGKKDKGMGGGLPPNPPSSAHPSRGSTTKGKRYGGRKSNFG